MEKMFVNRGSVKMCINIKGIIMSQKRKEGNIKRKQQNSTKQTIFQFIAIEQKHKTNNQLQNKRSIDNTQKKDKTINEF